jgi:tight adherence protein B
VIAMSFDFDPIYLIWLLVAASAVLIAEAIYLLCSSSASYRSQINRRLMLAKDRPDRESVLVEWRRERGLTDSGGYLIKFVAFNRLVLQSGITIGLTRLLVVIGITSVIVFAVTLAVRGSVMEGALAGVVSTTALPYLILRLLRGRRQKKFGAQFPDALDTIVRSLRAGHPVPTAIAMVGREMPDPIGSEFGVVTDEITYGADLETAMRNLHGRVGSEDLLLFVTASASRPPPAAILAKSLTICPASSVSASRCAARFARWRPKAALRR